MPALVVDTSAHPRAGHPRAMRYKCYDGSLFPHHTRMPALVVDTSAHPRAGHPRAMRYKCYDGSLFPHHTHVKTFETLHHDSTRLSGIRITWSDSADARTGGGYLCSPPSWSPPSYALQVL
ncbi:hypothetical protein DEO72_LG11g1341 [Vigna unguiculata]|uniref:Uncharacterized protein n=1 Tax=Vigna unguiculata TaxID=3917 RepID=A0A4D6NMV4_VIGUN|nr:hypothetical protein DEO72_LG11g1341 [Vigna unguiculata]